MDDIAHAALEPSVAFQAKPNNAERTSMVRITRGEEAKRDFKDDIRDSLRLANPSICRARSFYVV